MFPNETVCLTVKDQSLSQTAILFFLQDCFMRKVKYGRSRNCWYFCIFAIFIFLYYLLTCLYNFDHEITTKQEIVVQRRQCSW